MQHRTALGADLVIPALALAFTLYFLASVSGLEWEAKANGVIIGTILLVLIGVQAIRLGIAAARGSAERGFGILFEPRDAMRRRVGMLMITIVFVACVPWLGLALGLFLALAAGFVVMGVREPRRVLVGAFSVALASSLLFTVALDSGLPKGPVENFIIKLLKQTG